MRLKCSPGGFSKEFFFGFEGEGLCRKLGLTAKFVDHIEDIETKKSYGLIFQTKQLLNQWTNLQIRPHQDLVSYFFYLKSLKSLKLSQKKYHI